MNALELQNVWKLYGKVIAVKNLSFECKKGEFFAILGPSGCGKTSTLRMIAGLEKVSRGKILIEGKIVNDLTPAQRNTAMAFENFGLYPHMTVFENIAYPLRIRNFSPFEARQRVLKFAKILEIENILTSKPINLSEGQKQRVSLARALVRNPSVFLLDEPLSHLEVSLRLKMRAELKRLLHDLGATTILVTHDQLEALTMADRVAVLNEGVLQQVGSPSDLYLRPANLFVAGFVGEPPINFFKCKIAVREGQFLLFSSNNFSFSISKELYDWLCNFNLEEYIVGIRPNHLYIVNDRLEGRFKAVVYVIEPLGERTLISLKLDDYLIRLETKPNIQLKTSEEVIVGFEEKNLLFFNAENGQLLVR